MPKPKIAVPPVQIPKWMQKPKHNGYVVATSKGWEDEKTGEVLVNMPYLDERIQAWIESLEEAVRVAKEATKKKPGRKPKSEKQKQKGKGKQDKKQQPLTEGKTKANVNEQKGDSKPVGPPPAVKPKEETATKDNDDQQKED